MTPRNSSLAFRLTALVAAVLALLSISLVTVLYNAASEQFIETQRESTGATSVRNDAVAAALETGYARSGWRGLFLEAEHSTREEKSRPFLVLDNSGSIRWAPAALRESVQVSTLPGGTLQVTATARRGKSLAELTVTTVAIPLDAAGEPFARLVYLPPLPDLPAGKRFASNVWWAAAPWILAFVLLAMAATFIVVRVSLLPLSRLTSAAKTLADGNRPDTVPSTGGAEFREVIHAFNAAVRSLELTESLRKSLVSDVTHELRTPVTNLKAQLEALEFGLISWNETTAEILRRETRVLERLVEDFQQLMAFDAGSLSIHCQWLPARDTLHNILNPMVGVMGGRLQLSAPEGISLRADEDRLRQVFSNLLDNSARHVRQDLEIAVSVHTRDARAIITYSDNGPGIAAEDRPHVFERFYRADKSRNRSNGGAGLGLTIVKGIVEAMDGTIRLVGTTGAVFEISLPATVARTVVCRRVQV